MSFFKEAKGIGKNIYPIRTIGYLFGGFVLILYRFQIEDISTFSWIIFSIFILYPHLGFYWYQRNNSDSKVELRNLIFDGFLVGLFSSQLNFALLPVISFFVVVAATSMGVKGFKLFGGFCLTFLAGSAIGGLVLGFEYDPAPSLSVQLLSVAYLVIGTVSHNYIDYKRSQKFIAAKRQIQEQKLLIEENLKEKELLLKEIHHRVKNNLQIIMSLLNLQADKVEDQTALDAITASRGRVKSMSTVHEILYQNDNLKHINLKEYVPSLCDHIKKLYTHSDLKISIKYNIDDIEIDLKTAIPLGLILNEIISNSCKHAFLKRDEGSISIRMIKYEDSINLSVKDDGIGINTQDQQSSERDSLGMQLIEDMTHQLGAKGEIKSENGTVHQIKIPVHQNG